MEGGTSPAVAEGGRRIARQCSIAATAPEGFNLKRRHATTPGRGSHLRNRLAARAPSAAVAQPLEPRVLLVTYTVINTGVDAGSLRAAITSANASAGPDVIRFNIPGTPAPVHQIRGVLPEITETLDIDATTQPGYAAERPRIQLLQGPGLLFRNASNSRVR